MPRLALLLSLALVLPAHAQRQRARTMPLPDGWVTTADQEFAKVGERSLTLDVFHPKDADRARPLVVFVHGGGWRKGSKQTGYRRLPSILATGRYVGATISYRLSGEAIWPAQIHDCKAAIRWLRANAKRFGIDPARIGVWGTSAGGHLVSMLGTSGGVAALEGKHGHADQSSRVQCVIDFCGPTDLVALLGRAGGAVDKLLGGSSAEEVGERARQASPLTHVDASDPPFLIVQGGKDRLVESFHATKLAAALKAAGVRHQLRILPDVGHGIPTETAVLLDFLDRTIGPRSPLALKGALEEALARPESTGVGDGR